MQEINAVALLTELVNISNTFQVIKFLFLSKTFKCATILSNLLLELIFSGFYYFLFLNNFFVFKDRNFNNAWSKRPFFKTMKFQRVFKKLQKFWVFY